MYMYIDVYMYMYICVNLYICVYRDSIDSVQLEIVVGKMEKINIDFIDTNPRNVIIDPYLTLLKAILSSPLLPLCNNRVLILQSCYRESTKRIGQDRSQV
jgi:hypothetical protein